MGRYPYWGFRPNPDDLKTRKDIERIYGSFSTTEYQRFCHEYTWRNCRIGLEKEVEEKKTQFIAAEQRLQEAKDIEEDVKKMIWSLDIQTASKHIQYVFRILDEYDDLVSHHGVVKSLRYFEARIPRYQKDIPLLKDLSPTKFVEMVKDRTIIQYYLQMEIQNGERSR